jgi:hypothetical protein
MYKFTNTNPIHYVQHHTNTKPNTDAVKPTLSSPPTHGFTITHTAKIHKPSSTAKIATKSVSLLAFTPQTQDLYGLDFTQNPRPPTRVHPKNHHPKLTIQSRVRERKRREKPRGREKRKSRERESRLGCRAKTLHH